MTFLGPLLIRERDVIAQFIELLQREQASLRSSKPESLLELAEEKDKLAVVLSNIARQRCAQLAAEGYSADRQGVEAWCAKNTHDVEAGPSWAEILKLAGEARELQRVNGDLIALHLDYTTRALEVLSGSKKTLDLYGPDGQSSKPADPRINHKA